MIDFSLAAGIALLAGQACCISWLPTVIAASFCLIIAYKKLSKARVLALMALLGLGAFQSTYALCQYNRARPRARNALTSNQICSGTVRVNSCPMQQQDRFSFVAAAVEMSCEQNGVIHPGTLMRLYSSSGDIARNDVLDIVVRIGTIEISHSLHSHSALTYAARHGATLSGGVLDLSHLSRDELSPATWIDRARIHARSRIEATYPADAAPMARALVLGENGLSQQDAEAFRLSGLSHLLAVSGTHIIIAVFSVVALITGLLRRIEAICARYEPVKFSSALGIGLAWMYAEFAGSGGSVRRAAWMATIALGARVLGRKPNGVRAFGLSMLLGALWDPLAVFDVSFGLSAAATAGLLVLHRPLQTRLQRIRAPVRWCAPAVAATVSSSLFCLPWLMMLGPKVSLVGVAANIVAVPVGELICLPACLLHLLLFSLESAERGVALLGSGGLLAVRAIARHSAQIQWLAINTIDPTAWQLAITAACTVAVLLKPHCRFASICIGLACLLIAEQIHYNSQQPRELLRVTALDVGQGDSLLVDFPDGRAMLVDGGGVVGSTVDTGTRIVLPSLRARRRRSLSLAVVSHPHPDHYLGLLSALPSLHVKQLWSSTLQNQPYHVNPYQKLLTDARQRGVTVRYPQSICGNSYQFGQARMRVLGPCSTAVPYENDNNNSYILHLKYGSRSALLVGDAELEQEQDLLRLNPQLLRADLLKVGHHGSSTSTSQSFVEAVRPSVAIITSGVRNRYGHPSSKTLATLKKYNIKVYRSDRHGEIQWQTDGTDVTVTTAAQGN